MIEVKPYYFHIDNGVPRHEVEQAQQAFSFTFAPDTPQRVIDFILSLSAKLPNLERFKVEKEPFTGEELLLGGSKKEDVLHGCIYMVDVPVMQQVSPALSMYRIYKRKGRKGLVDYCKAKVNGTDLQRVLEILNVHVFDENSIEYNEILNKINQSKKIEADAEVV